MEGEVRMHGILLAVVLAGCESDETSDDSEPTTDDREPTTDDTAVTVDDTGGGDDSGGEETGEADDTSWPDPGPPGPAFDRFCGESDWEDTLVAGTVGAVTGDYSSVISSSYREEGIMETMKVIPPHPFHVTAIRVAFSRGPGSATLRLEHTWGRSYPASMDDDDEDALVTPAISYDVPDDAGPNTWTEVDVSNRGIYLEPTQHYMLVHEYPEDGASALAIAEVEEGTSSRALLFFPHDTNAYGVEGNFRMELMGDFFCSWEDEERWFEDSTADQPFVDDASSSTAFVDLDGDGHEDLVT